MLVFQKGKGWVEEVPVYHTIRMACGKRVRLEYRKPVAGERAAFNFEKYKDFSWESWARNNFFATVSVRTGDYFPDYDWCVVIPC